VASWKQALTRTRNSVFGGIARMLGGERVDTDTLEEWEAALVQADIPAPLVMEWMDAVRAGDTAGLQDRVRAELLGVLGDAPGESWRNGASGPATVLLVGVNGSGKTTTAAKLAHLVVRSGATPVLGAADTFRAAGSDQLRIWAERVGCDVVAGLTGADASAVAYDAVAAGTSRNVDAVIVDTAGRMHTRGPLMEELKKVKRAMTKAHADAPSEIWIVLDASLGSNALVQARMFHEAVGLTGVIVSKLDGSSKAGFLFAVRREIQVPVLYAGLGEAMDDLTLFDPEAFVDAILGLDA